MNKRYKELLDIVTKFPFLKHTVSTNIKEVYTPDEFLRYKEFIKDYDYDTDLFELSSKPAKYYRSYYYSYSSDNKMPLYDKEMVLLYNLITAGADVSDNYRNNYPVLLEICNVLINSLNIDATQYKADYFNNYYEAADDNEREIKNKIKAVGYIVSEFALADAFTKYMHEVDSTGKSKFIADIISDGPVAKQLNKLCKFVSITPKTIISNAEYTVYNKNNAKTLINAAVAKVYDSYSLEEIELFKTKAKSFSSIFDYFGIQIDREASLLNNHISDDARDALTKSFTSANDIAELTKKVISAFDAENSFDGEKVNLIISNVIVGNKKIRDRDFPETKDKVVHEFFRLLFISNSRAREYFNNNLCKTSIDLVFNTNIKYITDPYFLTTLVMKDSVISDHYTDMVKNTKKFVDYIFSSQTRVDAFIDNYLAELKKPLSERKTTVKSTKSDVLSYGILYYILKTYVKKENYNYNPISSDGIFNPIKTLLFAYGNYKYDIKKELLENSGLNDSSGYYYSSNLDSILDRTIQKLIKCGDYSDSHYTKSLIGIDGVEREVSSIDQHRYGSFNHIMSYLLGSDDDFEYNEDHSIGVYEGSRWGRSSKANYVPKKYYDYTKEAIKIILLALFKHIKADYGNVLTAEQMQQLKDLITSKDNTINILPDACFGRMEHNTSDDNTLKKEYQSDVTDYGCLNYIAVPSLCIYLQTIRYNKELDSLFKFNLYEDMVFLPELSIKFYENESRGIVSQRAERTLRFLDSMTTEELTMFKPILFDNFADNFAFTRTMQVCLFANMINAHDSVTYEYGSYKRYLIDGYKLQSDVSKNGQERPIDYVQVYYINVLYPRMQASNLISIDEIHEVEDNFNRAYTDYDCLLSLR